MRQLALALLALVALEAHAVAPAFSASASGDCNFTACDLASLTMASGGFTVVGVRSFDATDDLVSVSDGTNTYTAVCTSQALGGGTPTRTYWYKAVNTSAGAFVITVTFSTSKVMRAVAAHYTGAPTSGTVEADIECGQSAASTTITSGTVTTLDVDRRLVCIIGIGDAGATVAPASSETERLEVPSGTSRIQIEDKTAATAAGYSCSWTLGSSVAATHMAIALTSPGASNPAFDSGPTVTAVDTNTFLVTYDANAAAQRIFCSAVALDASPPNGAAIEAGTGAIGTATENTTGSSDTLNLDITGGFPAADVYCVLEEGTSNYSSVGTQADECLSAPSGKQIINCPTGLTSIGANGAVETLNARIDTDWAVGDIPICDLETSPGGTPDMAVTLSVAGLMSFSNGDSARQYVNCTAYDRSAEAMHDDDLDWWANDPSIVCTPTFDWIVPTGVRITTPYVFYDADPTGTLCQHPLGDVLTTELTDGTLPGGLFLVDNVLGENDTIANSAEDESGELLTFTVTDILTEGTGTQAINIYPLYRLTVPNCLNLTRGDCELLFSRQARSILLNASDTCSAKPKDGTLVYSQAPKGNSEIPPSSSVSVTAWAYSATGC